MCLLAVLFRAIPGADLVVGANREEAYQRGGEPPRVLEGLFPSVAGIDPQAHGTWLGVNCKSLVAAVTNRPKARVPPHLRSRGMLVRDLLSCASAAEAVEMALQDLRHERYAGCNLLCADPHNAYAIHAGDFLQVLSLTPGSHVLTTGGINDLNDARALYASSYLARQKFVSAEHAVSCLQDLCSKSSNENGPAICWRGSDSGTVSSTIIALRQPFSKSVYLHAQGFPDMTPYVSYGSLIQQLDLPSGQ
jgi:uncharacterized protein with NRDE domain